MEVKYNNNGSDPKDWGPGVWEWLHRLPQHGESVFRIASCLDHLCLPCPHCQEHYNQYKAEHPVLDLKTRDEAFAWINGLHNDVNERLDKPTVPDQSCFEKYCGKAHREPRSIVMGREVVNNLFSEKTVNAIKIDT